MDQVLSLTKLEDLQTHVHDTLCKQDNLAPAATPLLRSVILRHGKPCGLFFQVQGPRLLRNYAIWAGDENRILFYSNNGERFAETRLSEGPDPRTLTPAEPAPPAELASRAAYAAGGRAPRLRSRRASLRAPR